MIDLAEFIDRYVAVWNEPEEAKRRRLIPAIWSTEASLYNRLREYHGLLGIEHATRRSFDLFGSRGFTFHMTGEPLSHHGAIRFTWEMLDPDGTLDTLGMQFLILDAESRIRLDYQFIENQ